MNRLNFSFIKKNVLPHIIAILIFIGISSAFFYPQMLGYQLHQSDNTNYLGMSKEIRDAREIYQIDPLWTNAMFGGMPAYQISMRNPNVINTVKNYILKLIPRPIGYMFFLMAGFYIMLLCFRVDFKIAIIGAIAFGLSSYNILYLVGGHNTKIHAISFIPPIIGSIYYGYRRNYFTGSALLAIFVCLHISANHLQMTYYLLYMISGIALVEFVIALKEKVMPAFMKASLFLLLGGMLGLLPPVTNIMVTKEYSNYTTRGESELTLKKSTSGSSLADNALDKDYIKQYSFGHGEIWSLVIPNVKGGAMGVLGQEKEYLKDVSPSLRESISRYPKYWGEQYATGGAFYFGASIFLLFIFGAFFVKDKIKWAFLGVSLLAILLSWKFSIVTDFFIDHIPLYNKFRDTKMMLILVQISFSLLAILFINHLFLNQINNKKLIKISAGVAGILLIFYLFPRLFFDFFNRNEYSYFEDLKQNYSGNPGALLQIGDMQQAIENIRVSIFKEDLLRSFLFIGITVLLIYLYLKKRLKSLQFILVLGIIIIIDLWGVDRRYLRNEKKGNKYTEWVKPYNYLNPHQPAQADITILGIEIDQQKELNTKIEKALNHRLKSTSKLSAELENERNNIRFAELNFNSNYRVLSLPDPFNESRTSYYHKSIGGYHGAKLRRYQELIEFWLGAEIKSIIEKLNQQPSGQEMELFLKKQIPVLNMLNTKYIIFNPQAAPLINHHAYGNAWFADNLIMADNADQEMFALDGLNKKTAIIQKKYSHLLPNNVIPDTTSVITMLEYKPDHLTYQSETKHDRLAVFSEIFYDAGWNAYIDGNPVEYYGVNYVLRGLTIPAGEHKIEFKFEPQTYYMGRNISAAGSILILLYVLIVLFINKKSKTIESVE